MSCKTLICPITLSEHQSQKNEGPRGPRHSLFAARINSTVFLIGGNSCPNGPERGLGRAWGYAISLAAACSLMVETTRYSASRLPLISEPGVCSAVTPATWWMKSQANAEWAANEDSPATPSMAEDSDWMAWLDGVEMEDDVLGIWSSAGMLKAAWELICRSSLRSRSSPRTSPKRRSSWSIFSSLKFRSMLLGGCPYI